MVAASLFLCRDLQQLFQVHIPHRRVGMSAMPRCFIGSRDQDIPALAHSFDHRLHQVQLRWIHFIICRIDRKRRRNDLFNLRFGIIVLGGLAKYLNTALSAAEFMALGLAYSIAVLAVALSTSAITMASLMYSVLANLIHRLTLPEYRKSQL